MTRSTPPVGSRGVPGAGPFEPPAGPDAATTGFAQGWRRSLLVPTLVFIGLLVAMISSLGAPLIPTIATSYHVSLATGQWVLTGALLTGALATPILGRLADGPEQRRVIVFTMGCVFLGCLLAAVAPNFPVLVLGRVFQGFGLGVLPVTMAVARRHLDRVRATQAIATLSVSAAIGVGLGYPLTGLIAEVWSFHASYWFGTGFVLISLLASMVVLPPRSMVASQPFDLPGALLLTVAVVAMLVVLSEGGAWGWTSARTVTLAVTSALAAAIWIRFEFRSAHPLVDLRHLGNRLVMTADLAGFLLCVAVYLFIPIIVEFVQVDPSEGFGFGASILVAGLVLVPLSVGSFVASRFLLPFESHFGPRLVIPSGAAVFGLGGAFFAYCHSSLWEAFVAVGLAGLGVGFTFAAMPGFIVRAVPESETGSATGFYQVLRNLGTATGSALGGGLLASATIHGSTLPDLAGFHLVLMMSGALALVAAVASFFLSGPSMAMVEPSVPDFES